MSHRNKRRKTVWYKNFTYILTNLPQNLQSAPPPNCVVPESVIKKNEVFKNDYFNRFLSLLGKSMENCMATRKPTGGHPGSLGLHGVDCHSNITKVCKKTTSEGSPSEIQDRCLWRSCEISRASAGETVAYDTLAYDTLCSNRLICLQVACHRTHVASEFFVFLQKFLKNIRGLAFPPTPISAVMLQCNPKQS